MAAVNNTIMLSYMLQYITLQYLHMKIIEQNINNMHYMETGYTTVEFVKKKKTQIYS